MSTGNPTLNGEQSGFERTPELGKHVLEPAGVIRKNLKMQVYLGIALLFIVATAVSSLRHKPVPKQPSQANPMPPTSDANIEELRKSLELQQRQAAAIRAPDRPDTSPASPTSTDPLIGNAVAAASNCVPGQPCPPVPATGYEQYQH